MENLREDSKIWIYQAERALGSEEVESIGPQLHAFCLQWTAHNHQLKASYEIIQNRFIVLAVDESMNTASGCSIDKSVNFLKSLSSSIGVNLFERMQMVYLSNNEVKTVHFNDLAQAYHSGLFNENTLFYNGNIQNLAAYKTEFLIPLKEHWLYSRVSQ